MSKSLYIGVISSRDWTAPVYKTAVFWEITLYIDSTIRSNFIFILKNSYIGVNWRSDCMRRWNSLKVVFMEIFMPKIECLAWAKLVFISLICYKKSNNIFCDQSLKTNKFEDIHYTLNLIWLVSGVGRGAQALEFCDGSRIRCDERQCIPGRRCPYYTIFRLTMWNTMFSASTIRHFCQMISTKLSLEVAIWQSVCRIHRNNENVDMLFTKIPLTT